jgi:putative ABC transport system permease protein
MNYQRLLSSSLRNLARFKLRSFFMSIGVILGVATLVVGSTLGSGAEQKISDQINRMFGPGTIFVASNELKVADLDAIEDRVDQVTAVGPRMMLGEKEISYAGTDAQAGVAGYTANADYVWNRTVTDGRFFRESDVDRAARVALIGNKLESKLFGMSSGVGAEILVDSVPFEIVGILEPIGIDPHGEDRDMEVYVPFTTAQRRLANTDLVGMAKLVVRDADRVDEVVEDVATVLRDRFNIDEGERDTFGLYTSTFADAAGARMKRMLKVYVAVAAAVVLLVAAVVIASIMLVVVRERVAEVGLRKAVGATAGAIAAQFLWEATTVSLVSGLLGTAVGFGAAALFANLYAIPMEVRPLGIGIAIGASVVVGILSGILPARRAARLNPIEALR